MSNSTPSIARGGLLELDEHGRWTEPNHSYFEGTTLTNDAQLHPESFSLGMLEFVAAIVLHNNRVSGWLMRCRCGRYVRVPMNFYKSTVLGKFKYFRMKDMPFSCSECNYRPDHRSRYYPWPVFKSDPLELTHVPQSWNYKVLEDDFRLYSSVANRTTHPREYRMWENIITFDDTYPPWKASFGKFLNDVGERPSNAHILRTRNKYKPYTPANTYWHKHNYVVIKGKERQDHFAARELGVPVEYVTACRRGGLVDGETIQKRYESGQKPPTRYYELDHNRPQQFLLD